jgi:peroxiredoxin
MHPLVLLLLAAANAPDFALPDSHGTVVKLSALRGEFVLVNFWATHCGPCVLEMPWLAEFHQRFRPRKFRVIGVSLDESWREVRSFLAQQPVAYPIVLGTEALADRYKVEALPATFLVNRRGQIVWSHTGLIDRRTLDAVLRKHLR